MNIEEQHAEARAIWHDLRNIAINDDGLIQEAFRDFPVGTICEDIWHWIEETYHISVYRELMFPSELENDND